MGQIANGYHDQAALGEVLANYRRRPTIQDFATALQSWHNAARAAVEESHGAARACGLIARVNTLADVISLLGDVGEVQG
jgi:hypothetical protein